MAKKKKLTVTISPEAKTKKTFNLNMCLHDELGLEIHFADRIESSSEIKVVVRQIIKIPAKEMRFFALSVVDSLIEYEKEYNNGLGFDVPNETNEDTNSEGTTN